MSDEADEERVFEKWNAIPDFGVYPVPEEYIDTKPMFSILAKRGLLAAYSGSRNEPPETLISDMLADLRHLCDAINVDFHCVDNDAFDSYMGDLDHYRALSEL